MAVVAADPVDAVTTVVVAVVDTAAAVETLINAVDVAAAVAMDPGLAREVGKWGRGE